jgi:hypothetical protein
MRRREKQRWKNAAEKDYQQSPIQARRNSAIPFYRYPGNLITVNCSQAVCYNATHRNNKANDEEEVKTCIL